MMLYYYQIVWLYDYSTINYKKYVDSSITILYDITTITNREKIMQFKKAANRYQVLAYRGYDKAKHRPISRLVGSVGLESGGYVFAQRESEEVSDAEKGEISTFIKSLNEGLEKSKSSMVVELFIERAKDIVSLSSLLNENTRKTVLEAAGEVLRALGMDGKQGVKKRAPMAPKSVGEGKAATGRPKKQVDVERARALIGIRVKPRLLGRGRIARAPQASLF